MHVRVSVVLIFLLLFDTAGCSLAAVPEEADLPRETETEAAALRAEAPCGPPDAEGLFRILEQASQLQAGTAGSSLRAAALGGSLLRWLEENPQQGAAVLPEARRWALRLHREERLRIGRSLQLVRDAAARMKEEELENLLWDAGYEIGLTAPEREAFIGFADGLIRALMQGIFKNAVEIMNISR